MPVRTPRCVFRFGILLPALLWTVQGAGAAPNADKPKPPESIKPAERSKAAQSVKPVQPGKPDQSSKSPEPAGVADVAKDPDFVFQGEFVGPVSTDGSKYERWGLQVRPTGSGGFAGIQYPGGLPGEKAFRASPVALVGKRWERFLVLSGGPWAVFVEPDHCRLVDHQARTVGRLERVYRQSPTLGAPPPEHALVLFDGKATNQFTTARMTDDGLLMEGAELRPLFQDFNLHAEFLLPYMPAAHDQGRANSGLYLQSRYEIQVLDSFAEEPTFNGCGSLYRTRKPDLNMCLPPLVWQTYDIVFTAPRWASDGTRLRAGRLTVWLNGVKIHNNVELADKTGAGKPEDQTLLPIRFQDHRNPVRYRNIWIVDRGLLPVTGFPAVAAPAEQKQDGKRGTAAAGAAATQAAAAEAKDRGPKTGRSDAEGKPPMQIDKPKAR